MAERTIAHTSGDVYGKVDIKYLGTLAYTGYVGKQPVDLNSGYAYASLSQTSILQYYGGREA